MKKRCRGYVAYYLLSLFFWFGRRAGCKTLPGTPPKGFHCGYFSFCKRPSPGDVQHADQHRLRLCFRPRKSRAQPSHSRAGTPTAAATKPESKKASATYARSSNPSHVSGENHRFGSRLVESSVVISSVVILYFVYNISISMVRFAPTAMNRRYWPPSMRRFMYSLSAGHLQPFRTRAREAKRFARPRGRSAMSPGTSYRLVNVRSVSTFVHPSGRST